MTIEDQERDLEVIASHSGSLLATLHGLLWSIERGIGVEDHIRSAKDLTDTIKQKRMEAWEMSAEEQVTGTRYGGQVQGWAYHGGSDPDYDTMVAVVLDTGEEPVRLTIPMPVSEAGKVRRGDNVCVTVEITRALE